MSLRISSRDEEVATARIAVVDWAWKKGTKDSEVQNEETLSAYHEVLESLKLDRVPQSPYVDGINFLHSRRPFISRSGLVGLAPSCVEVGDEICVILGGHTPYIVSRGSNGVRGLRSETYVHSIMHGEFMESNPQIDIFTLS